MGRLALNKSNTCWHHYVIVRDHLLQPKKIKLSIPDVILEKLEKLVLKVTLLSLYSIKHTRE